MIVYIEDCLIENFTVTVLILIGVAKFLRFDIVKKRFVIAGFFASVFSVISPLLNLNSILLILFKLAVGYLIIAIAFDNKNILVKYVLFIFLTALYAGLNILIYYIIYNSIEITENFPTYILLVLLFIIYYLSNSLISAIKKKSILSGFVYEVKLILDDKEILTNAFLDSGNTLKDQDSTPVLIINFNLFNKLYKDISIEDILVKNFKQLHEPHYLKSKFALGSGNILVFTIPCVKIKLPECFKEIKNAKLGLAYAKFEKNFNCDMLLNINCFV